MTDKQTPTDAELEALLLDKLPASKHYIRPVIEKMVAAMQAAIDKWGQPAQETNGRKVFVCTHCDGVYADQPVTRCDCLPDENTFTEGWICFGAPAQAAEPAAIVKWQLGGSLVAHLVGDVAEGDLLYKGAPPQPAPLSDDVLEKAARYDFLRDCDLDDMAAKYWPGGQVPTGDEFDAAIGAALAAQRGK